MLYVYLYVLCFGRCILYVLFCLCTLFIEIVVPIRCSTSPLLRIYIVFLFHSIFVECIRIQKPLSLVLSCTPFFFFCSIPIKTVGMIEDVFHLWASQPATHNVFEAEHFGVYAVFSVSHKTKLNTAMIQSLVFLSISFIFPLPSVWDSDARLPWLL